MNATATVFPTWQAARPQSVHRARPRAAAANSGTRTASDGGVAGAVQVAWCDELSKPLPRLGGSARECFDINVCLLSRRRRLRGASLEELAGMFPSGCRPRRD